MKRRRTLLSRLADFFRGKKHQPAGAKPRPRRGERLARVRGVEPLEGRIAPASLISPNTVQYNDLDGDLVTVTFSKALFDTTKTTALNKLDQIFTFSNGTGTSLFDSTEPQQLQLLDLSKVDINLDTFISKADGTAIAITAAKTSTGDDLTNVGAIKATNIALGAVTVDGDLGQIDCGRGKVPVGLQSLVVNSMFKSGASTQPASISATDALESRITGELGSLRVNTDFFGYIHAIDGTSLVSGDVKTTAPAKITSVLVKGSIIGNATVAATSNNTGLIQSDRSIGTVRILGVGNDAGLIGGGGTNSGTIMANTAISSVTIADSIVGGGGASSGAVISKRNLATISVGDDVLGGAGAASGSIQARTLGAATIGDAAGDDLVGGGGASSGAILVDDTIASVQIAGSVTGAGGQNSGGVFAGGTLTSVLVHGDISGGVSFHSGYIESEADIGTARVLGSITGGTADRTGTIMAGGSIARAVVGEKLVGGSGDNSGSIFTGFDASSTGSLTVLLVKQGVEGGAGISSGSIVAGTIGTARIGTAAQGASVLGGGGDFSGSIISQQAIASLTVFGSLQGGGGDQSGSVQSHGTLTAVSISGSVAGGGGDLSGSILAKNRVGADQEILGKGNIGTVTIGAGLTGGAGVNSGRIEAAGNLTSLTVTGPVAGPAGNAEPSVVAGAHIGAIALQSGATDAVIRAGRDISSIVVDGDVIGSTISAVGQANPVLPTGDVAIATILVRGNVTGSQLLAGYDVDGSAVNADASIGIVRVVGNWTAGDIVAGVIDAGSTGFGDAGDTKITGETDRIGFVSQIARITVTGAIAGTADAGDHYGFVAQRILALKNGSTSVAFNLAAGDQSFELLPTSTNDVTAREVAV